MAKNHLGLNGLLYALQKVKNTLITKVDKVEGKSLSSNDFTDLYKEKLMGIKTEELHGHTNKAVLDNINADKTAEWDAKSTFSGKYADLSGKPTKVSEFLNDSGYQTAADVESTVTGKGYQTAADVESTVIGKGYQTAPQVQQAIATAGHLTRTKVSAVPAPAEAKDNVIYLVPKADAEEDNAFEEWMLIDGKMEKLGDSSVDLTGYLKESDVTEISNAQIDQVWNTVFGE